MKTEQSGHGIDSLNSASRYRLLWLVQLKLVFVCPRVCVLKGQSSGALGSTWEKNLRQKQKKGKETFSVVAINIKPIFFWFLGEPQESKNI